MTRQMVAALLSVLVVGAFGASKPGLVKILVSECDSEGECRELVNAAMGPYL